MRCFHFTVPSVRTASWKSQRCRISTSITSDTFFLDSQLLHSLEMPAVTSRVCIPFHPTISQINETNEYTLFPPLCSPVHCFSVVKSTYASPENSFLSTFLTLPSLSALMCPVFTMCQSGRITVMSQ